MDYETAVKQKMERQQREGKSHPFQQSYYTQQNYEIHKFLFWNYKKEVEKIVIPTGLCKICNKLAVEHD